MKEIHIHFTKEEFKQRQARVRNDMAGFNLDGLLLFKIEDINWLTGFDSDGFCIFNNMFIGTSGELTHLIRSADIGNAEYSSICTDIKIATDGEKIRRSDQIKEMLKEKGMQGKRVGIQVDTMGLTPRLYIEIKETLDGWCDLVVVDDFIRELRIVKSKQELDYLRRAGEILDACVSKAIDAIKPGEMDGVVYGAFYDSVFRMDGDLPAHIPPLGSGDSAMNVRYTTGRTTIQENDQVTLELGAGYRHYHTASMCVALTGIEISPLRLKMHEASVAALLEVQKLLKPGVNLGQVFDAYKNTAEQHGVGHTIQNACGYTMGAVWPPTWMEQPMIYADNSFVLEENMTIFTHMILNDHENGVLMAVGEQAIITATEPEIITHVSKEPILV